MILKEGVIVGIAAVAASFGGVAVAFVLPDQLSAQLFGLLLLGVDIQSAVSGIKKRSAQK